MATNGTTTAGWVELGGPQDGVLQVNSTGPVTVRWGDGGAEVLRMTGDIDGDGVPDYGFLAHDFASQGVFDVLITERPRDAATPPVRLRAYLLDETTADLALTASRYDDLVRTGSGSDRIDTGIGDDLVRAGLGNDTVGGGAGMDVLHGEDGDDRLRGGTDFDRLYGGAGKDWLQGEDGGDQLYGGHGDDLLQGGSGFNLMFGGDGADRIYGGDDGGRSEGEGGADLLFGGVGQDVLYGGDDADTLNGSAGEDLMFGEGGDDRLSGGEDSDTMRAGDGADLLDGGGGTDSLVGGLGADTLYGGAEMDLLEGGGGRDQLYGGAGGDVFSWLFIGDSRAKAGEQDIIRDFVAGEDRLDLFQLRADTDGNVPLVYIGTDGFTAQSGQLRWAVKGPNTVVQADTDGDGAADFEVILSGGHTLSIDDFVL
jgi:Ca2+-binding RTX toxin-like protein